MKSSDGLLEVPLALLFGGGAIIAWWAPSRVGAHWFRRLSYPTGREANYAASRNTKWDRDDRELNNSSRIL